MASEIDLASQGFRRCQVEVVRLGIKHHDPTGLGPFCRLRVPDEAPDAPGVYAWTVAGDVKYVGRSKSLRQITQGARMGRAYNDYTYIPLSKVHQSSSPRVRVNGLLNAALTDRCAIAWWWHSLPTEDSAAACEAELIALWMPDWNRAQPSAPSGKDVSCHH